MARRVQLQELEHLLPRLEEIDELRLRVVHYSVPDASNEWAGSRSFATIDRRLVAEEDFEQALDEAEQALHERIRALFTLLRPATRSFFADRQQDSAQALIQLALEQEGRGLLQKAKMCLNTALELALPLTDKEPQIVSLRLLGRVCWSLGELHEAAMYYQRALQLARDDNDLRNGVVAQTGLGNVLMMQGRWAEAEQQYRGAFEGAGDGAADLELERLHLCINLGSVIARQARPDEALDWFRRLGPADQIPNTADTRAVYYNNLAHLKRKLGEHHAARQLYLQGVEESQRPINRMHNALGVAESYIREHAFTEAERWARKAEEFAIAASSPFSLGYLYRELGNLARERGDADGFVFYEKALAIARSREYLLLEAETLVDYALLRNEIEGQEEAVSYLERAREVFRGLGDVGAEARTGELLEQFRPQLPTVPD